ncbi:MAG: TetR/AcrR family transcriptional regulator [Deltaproteobacteria bacterium]|nr:TetR/AcrR family transcriptional regulator [Deltaproteobacteria bacterium]
MSRRLVAHLRREQILNGLYKSIVKKGFLKTSITDISKKGRIARGIIHYYFKNKEEMLSELMKQLSNKYVVGLRKYINRFESPIDKLNAFVDYHLLRDEEDLYGLMAVWIEYWGQSIRNKAVNKIIFNLQDEIRKILDDIMNEGISRGIFINGNSRAVASILLAVMEGTMLQWRVNRESVNLRDLYSELKKIILLFKRKNFLQGVSYGKEV